MLHDGRALRVAVIGGLRIPFCRANSIYADASNQDMMTATLTALVEKYDLKGQTLGDVALGAVIKHSSDWNLARESVIGSGLSLRTPGVDMQRACGTSLEACINIANKIALGQIESGIAGGCDSVSDVPIVFAEGFRSLMLANYRGKSILQKTLPWSMISDCMHDRRQKLPKLPGMQSRRSGCKKTRRGWMPGVSWIS